MFRIDKELWEYLSVEREKKCVCYVLICFTYLAQFSVRKLISDTPTIAVVQDGLKSKPGI